MGADDFKNTIFAMIGFVVFSVLIITFVVGIAGIYDKDTAEISGGALNVSLFESSASNVSASASGFKSRFDSGTLEDVDAPTGILSLIKSFIDLITTPFQLISQVASNILHVPTIVINVGLGMLAITLILAGWRILRAGD